MPTQQENRSNKPVRMVAVDMDGTFLNDDKTFDVERFERILTRLSRHGIYLWWQAEIPTRNYASICMVLNIETLFISQKMVPM